MAVMTAEQFYPDLTNVQPQEMESGELWFPGELDGFALTPSYGKYNVRKVYRGGGRSRVLFTGRFEECKNWLNERFANLLNAQKENGR